MALSIMFIIIDDILLEPYQYSYFNEISRQYINDTNTDTDYWGFSLKEAYNNIDAKYNTQYTSALPAEALIQIPNLQFVNYNKDIILPGGTSVNVIGVIKPTGGMYTMLNPNRCSLIYTVSRRLLFKSEPIKMSKVYNCI